MQFLVSLSWRRRNFNYCWRDSISRLASQISSFHSTPTSLEKRNNKWDPGVRGKPPSKTYIRYAIRQKRADAKKALNDLLFKGSSGKTPSEDEFPEGGRMRKWDGGEFDYADRKPKKDKSKSSADCANQAHNKRKKQKFKLKRENLFDDFDDNSGRIFEAIFGDKCYTWSDKPWEESSFQSSRNDFEWRENPFRSKRSKNWNNESDVESDDESTCVTGSNSDRTILGLPQKGPLKIEDVKKAFRLSALKWHPDKHQGPSQAMAEEKFKNCVNAYRSWCNAIS